MCLDPAGVFGQWWKKCKDKPPRTTPHALPRTPRLCSGLPEARVRGGASTRSPEPPSFSLWPSEDPLEHPQGLTRVPALLPALAAPQRLQEVAPLRPTLLLQGEPVPPWARSRRPEWVPRGENARSFSSPDTPRICKLSCAGGESAPLPYPSPSPVREGMSQFSVPRLYPHRCLSSSHPHSLGSHLCKSRTRRPSASSPPTSATCSFTVRGREAPLPRRNPESEAQRVFVSAQSPFTGLLMW